MILKLILILTASLLATFAAIVMHQWLRLQRLRHRSSVSDISAWLGTMLRSFTPGSVLIAEANGKAGFIQFALKQRDKGWRRLEFGLPKTEWSSAAMADIQLLLDAAGASWTLEDPPAGATIGGFLRAELSGERTEVLERARSLIPRIAAAIGHKLDQTYTVRLLGDEAPEYPRELAERLENLPKSGVLEKRLAQLIRRRSGH